MVLQVCLAGATGWAGSELARSIARTEDLALVAAVARKHAGRVLGEVLDEPRLAGHIQVHSIRLPGYVISAEITFGLPDQKLTIRYDSGNSARPYADGSLFAIRKVATLVGVHRGLDSVLDL